MCTHTFVYVFIYSKVLEIELEQKMTILPQTHNHLQSTIW